MKELWLPIIGFESRYMVSSLGRVKSLARIEEKYIKGLLVKYRVRERILSPTIAFGYPKVVLNVNTKKRWAFVHRLVAEAFIPNPDKKREVNHKDMNRMNCVLSNLEWTTSSENKRHARKNGRYKPAKGEACGSAILTESIVRAARAVWKAPNRPFLRDLASSYGISMKALRSAIHGQTWKHVI